MPKSKLLIFAFLLFLSFVGLVIGMYCSRFFIPKNAGLAGGAMVLMYGLIGVVVAIVGGWFLQRNMNHNQLKWGTLILGLATLFVLGRGYYMLQQDKKTEEVSIPPKALTTEPIRNVSAPAVEIKPQQATKDIQLAEGIGMGRPDIKAGNKIYFYESPNEDSSQGELTPIDSFTFVKEAYGIGVDKLAAAWLQPKIYKLDYDIMYFLIKSRKGEFLEVETNRGTKKTAWIKSDAMQFLDWPTFLIGMHSVEPIHTEDNLLRTKPELHAEPLFEVDRNKHILNAVEAKGDWLRVEVQDMDYQKIGTGWIRWRNEQLLLVDYNLLS